MTLIDSLIQKKWLKTPLIIEAFKNIKRKDFMPEKVKDLADLNEAIPIGFNQTISQPLTVAFMLEKLKPKAGDKILDIGSGSGWTTALLAYIVSQEETSKFEVQNSNQIQNLKSKNKNGKVIAIEIIPELKEFGERNTAKYNFIKKGIAKFICADGSKGYEKESPFDKILVSASAEEMPENWKKQLKIGGRIVCSIKNSIWVFEKKAEDKFEEKEYPGFVFVPLVSKEIKLSR